MSIYGDRFADENFDMKHTGSGLLSMVNINVNYENSRLLQSFTITTNIIYFCFYDILTNRQTVDQIPTDAR